VAALRRSLRRRGLSPADADDVVQEVLIEVYLATPDPEGHEVERASWRATVTRRTAGRFCARLFRQREIPTLHDNGAVALAPAPAFLILQPASDGAVAAVPLRVPPRKVARAEHDLMQRARVAHAAQSSLVARRILERHARMFPRSRYAEERQALLAELRAMARKPSTPGVSAYQ